MLGKASPQGGLFRPDNLYRQHVGEGSFYGFLSETGPRMFRDEDFSDLYKYGGRPSVPPSQLCVALLLQAREFVSDEEAIARTAYDLRWKLALGLELEAKLCAKSTLQEFRTKLILNEKYQDLFHKSVEACQRAGLMKRKKLQVAIDTTPVFGRGAVKDTFNLVSDQIQQVIHEVVALKGWEQEALVDEHGLGRHFGKSFKGSVDLDWSDKEQRRALVSQLVADARVVLELAKAALRGYCRDSEQTGPLREARDLLSELLLQDIKEQPEDGGGPQIRQGTKRDRIVSTTDTDMRHGRKSDTKTFNGFKASVVAETESGVILATDIRAANVHDGEGAAKLVAEASKSVQEPVATVLGDTAYGSVQTREELEEVADEVVAKAPPAPHHGTRFTLDDFKLDKKRDVMVCPAGKESVRRDRVDEPPGRRYVFSRGDCGGCSLRADCTKAKTAARSVTVTEVTRKQQLNRKRQRTKRFKKAYRRRVVVEHRIARLVQLGIRKARYLGKAKVAFQVAMAATVANLTVAVAAIANRGRAGGAASTLFAIIAGLRAGLSPLRAVIRRGSPVHVPAA